MVNYNQKFKNEVIVTIMQPDGNSYDSNISDNKYFSAVGQKTSGSFNNISQVNRINIWAVKPDTILNLENGSIKVYDDDGNIVSIPVSGQNRQQYSSFGVNLSRPLRFNTRDNNIRFDNFNDMDGMT